MLWEMSNDPSGYVLHMKWQESGGPPIVENRPSRGFGTRLIERTVSKSLMAMCGSNSLRLGWSASSTSHSSREEK